MKVCFWQMSQNCKCNPRSFHSAVRGSQDPVPLLDAELAQVVDAGGRHLEHGLRQHGALPLPKPRGALPGIQAGIYISGELCI